MLFKRQSEREPYASVSMLLLRWEDDAAAEADVAMLERLVRERFRYKTHTWSIPTVPNPSTKLGSQLAKFLELARPNHLLIVYYVGGGYLSADGQVYWAW